MDGHKIKIRSAKRGKKEHSGIHDWHPYYAGFSEDFVNDMISMFNANDKSIILDPWVGSGTTTLVCQKHNIKSIGIEINPVMVHFSRAKSADILKYDITTIIKEVINDSNNNRKKYYNEEILQYLNINEFSTLKKIEEAFLKIINIYDDNIREILMAFFYAVIFRCMREIGNFEKGSNPTWLSKSKDISSKNALVYNLFENYANTMISDLQNTFFTYKISNFTKIFCGNSKDIPLDNSSIDYIITSPPYLTRIDYAMSTKPELLFLGYTENDSFDKLRRETMGAPVISDKSIKHSEEWGSLCLSFLEKVKNHKTKAAKSYYYPIFLQYFNDTFKSLNEINRVLKPGGKAALVVQTSYFKDIEIELTKMYVEMANNIGFCSEIINSESIRSHLAHVNVKSSKYVKNKVYYEDVILLTKLEFPTNLSCKYTNLAK